MPLDRSDGGWVAPDHHANTGGRGHALRPWGREPHGSVIGRPGWEPRLRRSGLIQPRMAEMHPLMGVRLGHPTAWSLDCLEGDAVSRRSA